MIQLSRISFGIVVIGLATGLAQAAPAAQAGSFEARITPEAPPTNLRESKALVPSNTILKSWAQQTSGTTGPSAGPAPVYRTMEAAATAGVNPMAPPVKNEPINLETPAAPLNWQRLALLGGGLFAGVILLFSLLSRAKRTRSPDNDAEDDDE